MVIRYQYDADSLPVYFAPEAVHVGNWFQEVATPVPPPRIEVRNIPFELSSGAYFGIELTAMDKWYQPLSAPGRPKKLITANIPSHWLVQFTAPTFPIPSVSTWFVEWDNPVLGRSSHPSEFPFASYAYLPPVTGCIEAEVTQFYVHLAYPRPQMPVLYIRNWNRYSTSIECGSTQQSPSSQPEYSVG